MNTLVVIKTKFASIEQKFSNHVEASIFLKNALNTMDVVSYELRQLK